MIVWLLAYYYSIQAAIWAYLMGWRGRALEELMKKRYSSLNTWAVVSGGSDGVGLGFVRVGYCIVARYSTNQLLLGAGIYWLECHSFGEK